MSLMQVPKVKGLIERRMLINYKADPEVISKNLPHPFRPLVLNGYGMVGICLIRLSKIRPFGLPAFFGLKSENAAHRYAVEWDEDGEVKQGVYIPRRDSSSKLNALLGGRLFPGTHHLSKYKITEEKDSYCLSFKHNDGTCLDIKAKLSKDFPKNSLFKSLDEASEFFKNGALGFSPNKNETEFQGLKLVTPNWTVHPLDVETVYSSYFEDRKNFPKDSVTFDHALLMKNIEHEWVSNKTLSATT